MSTTNVFTKTFKTLIATVLYVIAIFLVVLFSMTVAGVAIISFVILFSVVTIVYVVSLRRLKAKCSQQNRPT